MCWNSQLAQRYRAKSVSEIGSSLRLKPRPKHLLYLSPNFYREWKSADFGNDLQLVDFDALRFETRQCIWNLKCALAGQMIGVYSHSYHAKAGMVHSVSGWTRGVQVKLRSLENAYHTWAPYLRQGAIQIHVYLTSWIWTRRCGRDGNRSGWPAPVVAAARVGSGWNYLTGQSNVPKIKKITCEPTPKE